MQHKMKHLFVIRHGDCDLGNGDLSPYGINQIKRVAGEMKSIVGEDYSGHQIVSSVALRAQHSADIIAETFGLITFNRTRELWTEGGRDLTYEKLRKIDNLVEPYTDNDVVTLITHYEVLEAYPMYVVEKFFGKKVYIPRAGRGEGVHFDFEKKTYHMIPKIDAKSNGLVHKL